MVGTGEMLGCWEGPADAAWLDGRGPASARMSRLPPCDRQTGCVYDPVAQVLIILSLSNITYTGVWKCVDAGGSGVCSFNVLSFQELQIAFYLPQIKVN